MKSKEQTNIFDWIANKRKEYNKLKAETKKALIKGKKSHYIRENEKIKKLPVKQRTTARKKLKADLKQRLDKLVKQRLHYLPVLYMDRDS